MPPLPNLRPHPLDFTRDTPEFIAAAHAQAKRTGVNPLYWQHGSCPFAVDSEVFEEPVSVTGYTVPPPLLQICEDTTFVILQQINETGNVPMFKIRLNGELRLLKIVRSHYRIQLGSNYADDNLVPRPRREHGKASKGWESELQPDPQFRARAQCLLTSSAL